MANLSHSYIKIKVSKCPRVHIIIIVIIVSIIIVVAVIVFEKRNLLKVIPFIIVKCTFVSPFLYSKSDNKN